MSRNSIPIDSLQLHGVLQLLTEVNLYKKIFHKQFLKTSEEFCNQESEAQIKARTGDLPCILNYIEKRLIEEQKIGNELLEESTIRELMRIIDQKLIVENLQILLGVGFNGLASSADFENLFKLYEFVERVNKLDFLKKTWNFYIKEVGQEILSGDEAQILPKLLDLKVRMIKIIEKSFRNSKAFLTSMDYAFEYIMNLKTNTMAEITSSAIDFKLKQEIKQNVTEQSLKEDLMIYLDLFKYLTAKDIFEAFYTKRLVKRLLFGLSKQENLEQFVLEKLQQQCGQGYTKKAEYIFQDIEISKSFQLEFSSQIISNQQQLPKLDFQINIFQSSAWPLAVATEFTSLFTPFKEWVEAFESFYSVKQPGKNLTWQIEASTCEIYCYFSEKYLFEVGILQAVLLNLFNLKNEYSYSELLELMKIDQEELKKTLISLFKMKESQRLLIKSGDAANISDGKFSLNLAYTSKSKKIKVSTIQKKESKQEIIETTQKVLQERQYVIDACIVKILKNKKTIAHNQLIEEVFTELKLPLQANEIKKRIESLINRDYMARDPENNMQYNYIA